MGRAFCLFVLVCGCTSSHGVSASAYATPEEPSLEMAFLPKIGRDAVDRCRRAVGSEQGLALEECLIAEETEVKAMLRDAVRRQTDDPSFAMHCDTSGPPWMTARCFREAMKAAEGE
jgi:hypothetical protein